MKVLEFCASLARNLETETLDRFELTRTTEIQSLNTTLR